MKKIKEKVWNLKTKIIFTLGLLFALPSSVYAQGPGGGGGGLDQAVDMFVTALEDPMKTGASVGFVYGVVSMGMAMKEDNPQAKSSAIKWMVGSGVVFIIAGQISNLV